MLTCINNEGDFYMSIINTDPVDYTDGTPPATGEGVYGKGSMLINVANGHWFSNTGTKAQPTWSRMARFSEIPGDL